MAIPVSPSSVRGTIPYWSRSWPSAVSRISDSHISAPSRRPAGTRRRGRVSIVKACLRFGASAADTTRMRRLRPLLERWHQVIFAGCAAWLVLYELRVVVAPDLGLGPFTSRFAHDVVLLLASALCLAHGIRAGRERLRLAADRRRRARLVARRGLLHRRPVDGRRHPDPVARRHRLPAAPAARARRHPAAAARPRPPRPQDAVGRRRRGRARRRLAERRARLPGRARQRRGPGARGRHQPRLSDRRPRPARADRRRAGRHRLAAGPHLDPARDRRHARSGSPTRCTSSAPPRARSCPAAGSTRAGGPGCS